MPSTLVRPSLDRFFINLLEEFAARSTCPRRQVACIITDAKGRVLSTGYNGVPSGMPHCIDSPCEGANDQRGDSSRCLAIHAEQNALLQCHRLDLAHTLYCSSTPCFTCAKLICNTGIKRVVFQEQYADQKGFHLFRHKGIQLKFMPDKDMQ